MSATDAVGMRALTLQLADRLARRIRRVRAGEIRASPARPTRRH